MKLTALVVADPAVEGDSALDLIAVLRAGGNHVHRTTVTAILARSGRLPRPDVVLVHARVDVADMNAIKNQLHGNGVAAPILVFSGRDHSLLEPHMEAGYDYLVPPFMPLAVHNRVLSSRRTQLVRTVEEVEAVANLLKYEQELQIAREIQRGFLPSTMPSPQGWEVEVRFRPAREVAGDFYDGFELLSGRRFAFLIADVCDKGVGAALFMALIRTLLRHGAQQAGSGELLVADLDAISRASDPTPSETDARSRVLPTVGALPLTSAVRGTNEYMIGNHQQQGYFVTLFFFVLDPDTGSTLYINAGHNPPVLLRADGRQEPLPPTGPAVGLVPAATFELGHVTLDVGDTLFTYTDGVTEARDEGRQFFTDDRMLDLLATPVESADELLTRVETGLDDFVGSAEQSDDITMLALRRE